MKKILLSLLFAFLASTTFSQSGDIAVAVISSETGTGLTTINYQFTGQENKIYNITAEVKFDDADYVQISEAHLSGDLSNVSGTGTTFSGTIIWNGAAGFSNRHHEQTRIRILATMDNSTIVVDVTNPNTGKTWMDRNLGASQAATSIADANAYGDLYQWGRGTDGHEKPNSPIISTLSNSDTPGHGNFITININPHDWRSPKNDNLWQGLNGINNPCPSGYRIPTQAEWNAEIQSLSSENTSGAFASPLKLPAAGYRLFVDGSLNKFGEYGHYWSSTISGQNSIYFSFSSSNAVTHWNYRVYGFSVRCIKD